MCSSFCEEEPAAKGHTSCAENSDSIVSKGGGFFFKDNHGQWWPEVARDGQCGNELCCLKRSHKGLKK